MKRWSIFLSVMLLAMVLTVVLPAITAIAQPPSPPPQFLYGYENSSSIIYKIDTSTGMGVPVGSGTGFPPTASCMATCQRIVNGPGGVKYDSGTIFALLTDPTGDYIVVVDPTTGVATKVVQISRSTPILARGMAFGPDGTTLYLIEGTGDLSIIDTVSGAVTQVGNTGSGAASLELDPVSGTFYYITTPSAFLVNIDLIGTFISKVEFTIPACTLVRSPGGDWYTISNNRLYSIDISTGAASPIGPPVLGQICGTAFAPEKPVVYAVDIDIKPGSYPNSINMKSKGVIPVALLGSDWLDVYDVRKTTLRFGPGPSAPAPERVAFEDVNGDGFMDLICHFRTQDVPLEEWHTKCCLRVELLDGTPLRGCDEIRIVGSN